MSKTEPEISGVSEAFSMQPAAWYVGMALNGKICASIKLERIDFPINGDPMEYRFYVGRDKDGNKMFQLRAEACNVSYK